MLNRHLTLNFFSLVLVLVISGTFATYVLGGISRLDPTNEKWMFADFVPSQAGWYAFEKTSLPLTTLTSDVITSPVPISIAMFDLVPIVAFILKSISGVVPMPTQYLGPLIVCNAMLQGLFGFLLMSEVTPKFSGSSYARTIILLFGSLLLSLAPVFYQRIAMTHPSLTEHWLILCGLWIYIRSDRVSRTATFICLAALFFVAGGINPYMLVMTASVGGASIIHMAREEFDLKLISIGTILVLLSGLVSLITFGFLPIGGSGVIQEGGYRIFSSNLVSFVNPMSPSGSTFLPDLPVHHYEQLVEGFGYLGFGAIVLILISIVVTVTNKRITSLDTKPLLFIAIIMFAMSLTTKITLGSEVIADILLPDKLMNLLQVFRSCGRFIWVADYCLIVASISVVIKLPQQRSAFILFLCSALQLADLLPALGSYHRLFEEKKPIDFTDAAYKDLGKQNDTLMVIPPWECYSVAPEIPLDSIEPVISLVMEQGLKTNNFRAGRLPYDQFNYHCKNYQRKFATSNLMPTTAYLLLPDVFFRSKDKIQKTHYCDFAKPYFVCRGDAPKPGLAPRAQKLLDEFTIKSDHLIDFTNAEGLSLFTEGFKSSSGNELIMVAESADIKALITTNDAHDLKVKMAADDKASVIDLYCNNLMLGSLNAENSYSASFWLPSGLADNENFDFRFHNATGNRSDLRLIDFDIRMSKSITSAPLKISFSNKSGPVHWLTEGWSKPEEWGVWSEGKNADVELPTDLLKNMSSLTFDVDAFLDPSYAPTEQTVRIRINGREIKTEHLSKRRNFMTIVGSEIPLDALKNKTIKFEFLLPDAAKPSDHGISSDQRMLGVGLHTISINKH